MNLYFQSPEDYNRFCEDIKIFKDSYETHKAWKDALEKGIAEKKKNNEIVGDAEIYQLGFSSGIVSALTDIALKTGGLANDK